MKMDLLNSDTNRELLIRVSEKVTDVPLVQGPRIETEQLVGTFISSETQEIWALRPLYLGCGITENISNK